MDQATLSALLTQLISNWESEVVEFKRGKDGFQSGDLGKYVSALANEANLRGRDRAWLVFGVDDKTRVVVGTSYKENPAHLQADKMQLINGTGSFTARDIHVLNHPSGRVVLFEIPAAPRGMPINWNGHYYGRAGESLVALGPDKLDEIRAQTLATDWTAQVVEGASFDDLDPQALKVARERFAAKHANRFNADEIAGWSDAIFLNRAKMTQNGAITRAALLLLGKAESAWRLNPHPVEITWKLEGEERAYEHFGPPFLLTSSKVFARIRNIQLRLLPENELLAHEVAKYDQKVVLEALHNCIAHQDYARMARIIVTERPDRLILVNEGGFFEGEPDDYVLHDHTPLRYRNPFLTQAMTELNMIDHMGYGIQDIYRRQRQRFFPLPDYDLTEPDLVRLTIHGRVVDEAYSQLLMQQTGLPLADVLALDRVQKHLPITDDAVRHLRQERLIEGRKPNFFISARVADATSQKAQYIKTRAFDDYHYEEMVVGYLREFGQASRKELDDLLRKKLSDVLNETQKTHKIGNLLSALRRKGRIRNFGSTAAPEWRLVE
ncbi:RNA-binding domain-containing protein [Rhizobium etli]|uniref:ATP-dependent DNA helicase RecG n=1 Tax=Rhizobium etli TaxID=29449 RepID=A0A7W6V8Z7_RHIET|nr:RNA-binding domain-containing protein [Rhizobium etli]MBB4478957.1 ATP-dependent DNA helicase RecG [Rhizobium etli]MBB4534849.1 ATP-dependent DNA helicase RecG [Rhizobium etli]